MKPDEHPDHGNCQMIPIQPTPPFARILEFHSIFQFESSVRPHFFVETQMPNRPASRTLGLRDARPDSVAQFGAIGHVTELERGGQDLARDQLLMGQSPRQMVLRH